VCWEWKQTWRPTCLMELWKRKKKCDGSEQRHWRQKHQLKICKRKVLGWGWGSGVKRMPGRDRLWVWFLALKKKRDSYLLSCQQTGKVVSQSHGRTLYKWLFSQEEKKKHKKNPSDLNLKHKNQLPV
jgi:hypothetical protein